MDGIPQVDGAFDAYWQGPTGVAETVQSITNALEATLDPRTSNEVRAQAREYLESVKNHYDAPQTGFTMADDFEQGDAVRYYGLQLLEHAVRYKWGDYRRPQIEQIIEWVKRLAGSVRAVEKSFIRNKIAQVWADVAKRTWGEEWVDMDNLLITLWDQPREEKGFAAKLLVLYILETLSEDIINGEDALAGLRLDVLGQAMNDIMVPPTLYQEFQQNRGKDAEVRFGEGGWLSRICELFATCLKEMKITNDRSYLDELSKCAVKTLQALRPTMQWIHLKGPAEVNMVGCLTLAFHMDDVALQTAAAESLYTLLNRAHGPHQQEAWHAGMQQALLPDVVALIKSRFESIKVSPSEDEETYLLQKKLSEMISVLADAVAMHPDLVDGNVNMPTFFELLQNVLQNNSLVVSIPVLHSWTKLLASDNTKISNDVFQGLGVLVQTCSTRLLRYESIADADAEGDEIVQFLFDDFDTMPERHAFLGNYRRYCVNVIQTIARTRPNEALEHVLDQMRSLLENGPYTFGRGFDSATYGKSQLSVLRFDAQYQVVSSALKGYSAWLADTATIEPDNEMHARVVNDRDVTMKKLQQWSYGIINMHIDDPEVAALVLTTLVQILRAIKPDPSFVLRIVQHLLTMQLYDNAAHETFSEAIKSFESLRVVELQKLALAFSNELLEVYYELEPRINVSVQKHSNDPRLVWGYRAFLFMIIHRAYGIDNGERMSRLQAMLKPVYDGWYGADNGTLRDLPNFCDSLGLGNLDEFYKAYRFAETADWSAQQLDEAGQARQALIKAKVDELPLRMTKSMLAATAEKLKSGTDEYETACELWSSLIMVVLPSLLKMVRYAQAFHNMSSWSHLPADLQAVVKRTLQDRFWQSGISNESKEEFYARISGSKTSYEGFASVVRGTMRNIREQGFHIIYLMTKFEEQFFGHPGLAQPLADALYADADSLSPNHLHPAINLTNGLVQRCPPHHRATFLPPLLRMMFVKLGAKISAEWEAIDQANQTSGQDDELGDEMRLESVLRQLTYSMVTFVPFLLEFENASRAPPQQANGHSGTADVQTKPALSQLVLSDISILEPLMLFCTHALRMRDTRCCTTITKVFRIIIPLFTADASSTPAAPGVREFVSSDVLKACITSLNEPYFADMQKDLASLIAQILFLYTSLTSTPRDILLSLPDMQAAKVDKALTKICKSHSERQQRSLVLDLLEGVRGVSIYEAGKIARETPKRKAPPTQARYMETDQQVPHHRIEPGDEVGLEGVAGMFGDR